MTMWINKKKWDSLIKRLEAVEKNVGIGAGPHDSFYPGSLPYTNLVPINQLVAKMASGKFKFEFGHEGRLVEK